MGKILPLNEAIAVRGRLRDEGKSVVFTNGTFDILHRGHVEYLLHAKNLGDVLIVGLNSDASTRRIKGERRPIVPEEDRAFLLANLLPVDYVVVFEEDTPLNLITALIPDTLVKGADWSIDAIVGKDVVEKHGGRVATIAFVPDRSTTGIIERIRERFL